ncbi:MAG: Ig-like domain-containing protein [Bacteroidota bacterium]|nr:Ig-like domain-containing protein [Bacteroidota bacterium]
MIRFQSFPFRHQLLVVFFLAHSLSCIAQSNIFYDFEAWDDRVNVINQSGTILGVPYAIIGRAEYADPTGWSTINQLSTADSLGNDTLVRPKLPGFLSDTGVSISSRALDITVETAFGPQTISNVAPGMMVNGVFDIDLGLIEDFIALGSLDVFNPFTYPNTGVPVNNRPKSWSMRYEYQGVSNDSAIVAIAAKGNNQIIGYSLQKIGSTPSNLWGEIGGNLTYISCDAVDSMVVFICASNLDLTLEGGNFQLNSDFTGNNGSTLIIDQLDITMYTGDLPPIANDDQQTIYSEIEDTIDVLVNDILCSSGAYTVNIITPPSSGSASILGSQVVYTSNQGYLGSDFLEYAVCDTANQCDTAEVALQVSPIPSCQAGDVSVNLCLDDVEVYEVGLNDSNCELIPILIDSPVNVVAQVLQDGKIAISSNATFIGTEVFTYAKCSPLDSSDCDTAEVYVNVVPCTSIEDISSSLAYIYPNPGREVLTIQSKKALSAIQVIDQLGHVVYTKDVSNAVSFNHTLNTSNLAQGYYTITGVIGQGQSLYLGSWLKW